MLCNFVTISGQCQIKTEFHPLLSYGSVFWIFFINILSFSPNLFVWPPPPNNSEPCLVCPRCCCWFILNIWHFIFSGWNTKGEYWLLLRKDIKLFCFFFIVLKRTNQLTQHRRCVRDGSRYQSGWIPNGLWPLAYI